MSFELPLSISTQCMLNFSILSIITSGLSWGCLTPRASFSEKTMSVSLYLGVFEGGNRECMMFTSLAYALFSDQEDPPTTNPSEIILISPMRALLPPLSLAPFPSCPFVVFYTTPFFIRTSTIFPNELMFLFGPSGVCIR